MKINVVPYDIAVKLRKKGFNIDTDFCYNQDGGIVRVGTFPAPQTHEVLEWLRKEKNLHIEIVSTAYGYIYIISDTPNKGGTDRVNIPYKGKNDGGAWDDYNECVLDAIENVIDNLI